MGLVFTMTMELWEQKKTTKATYRKLKLLKDMGVNSIRTTHNPASPQLLDAAASLGLLVQEEAFDTWLWWQEDLRLWTVL